MKWLYCGLALLTFSTAVLNSNAVAKDFNLNLDDELPDYKNTQLPSITSCDPKNPASTYFSAGGSTAAGEILKTAANAAISVKDSYDPMSEEESIDGKATIDTPCDEPASIATDNVDKLACRLMNADYIDDQKKEVAKAIKAMACQRGVLTAMGGEVACLKKQIGEAEKVIDAIVNSPGGLASMLKTGQDTFQDRSQQLKTVTERIKGNGSGNIGLEGAAKLLQDLGVAVPAQVELANTQVTTIREDQARFETLVKQVETAQILKCMNTPVEDKSCLMRGATSSSKKYATGPVSPLDHYKCIYAQSANKVVDGTPVLNPGRETELNLYAEKTLTIKSGDEISAFADFPQIPDADTFRKSSRTFELNTPADLYKRLKEKVGTMNTAGKNFSGQLDIDFKRCQRLAESRTAKDRSSATSTLRSGQNAMDQSFTKIKSQNATAFRDLRNKYAMALKAATGVSRLPDTQNCEKGSIEAQAQCFDALNSMVDTLYTGKTRSTDKALGAAALGLTGGANPVRAFLGSVPATNDKSRTIPVDCAGVDDCLTKYNSVESGLRSFTESYPANLNNTIQQTAMNISTGSDPKTGQPVPGASNLLAVTQGIEAVKAKLMSALSKLGVDDGLNLDPKSVTPPEKDPSGLFQTAGLKNLVLAGLNPGLPDSGSKGFGDTLKAINERKKEIVEQQGKLATFMQELDSRKLACEAETSKGIMDLAEKKCDKATDELNKCIEAASKDPVSQVASFADYIATFKNGTPQQYNDYVKSMRSKQNNGAATTGLNCGISPEEKNKACDYFESLSDNKIKDFELKLKNKNSGIGNDSRQGL